MVTLFFFLLLMVLLPQLLAIIPFMEELAPLLGIVAVAKAALEGGEDEAAAEVTTSPLPLT